MTELEMFTKLPQLSEDYKETKFSYIPTLSLINNILADNTIQVQYIVCWVHTDIHDVLEQYFIADTPEEAIRKAYEWCDSNNLLSN